MNIDFYFTNLTAFPVSGFDGYEELMEGAWSVGVPSSNGEHYENTLCIIENPNVYVEGVAKTITKIGDMLYFIRDFVADFEAEYVFKGRIIEQPYIVAGRLVDNPTALMVKHYEAAKALLKEIDSGH